MANGSVSRRRLLSGTGAGAALALAGGRPSPAAAQQSAPGNPPFKLGTISYNVPKDWDLPTLLKICPAAGLHALEFRTTHAHGVEVSLNSEQRREVRQRCADAGIKQLSLGTVCEFHSPDKGVVQKHIEDCRQWVTLAKEIGALGIKVRPNGLPKEVPVEKTLEQIGHALRQCGDFAKDAGVEIWVEVHGLGTQDPANMRKIMDYCGHPSVGICWNSNPGEVKDGSIKEAFELLKPNLMSVHINNLWGPYPYRELFGLLREAKFNRYTLCEVGTPVKAEDGLLFFQCYHGLWRELARG